MSAHGIIAVSQPVELETHPHIFASFHIVSKRVLAKGYDKLVFLDSFVASLWILKQKE